MSRKIISLNYKQLFRFSNSLFEFKQISIVQQGFEKEEFSELY